MVDNPNDCLSDHDHDRGPESLKTNNNNCFDHPTIENTTAGHVRALSSEDVREIIVGSDYNPVDLHHPRERSRSPIDVGKKKTLLNKSNIDSLNVTSHYRIREAKVDASNTPTVAVRDAQSTDGTLPSPAISRTSSISSLMEVDNTSPSNVHNRSTEKKKRAYNLIASDSSSVVRDNVNIPTNSKKSRSNIPSKETSTAASGTRDTQRPRVRSELIRYSNKDRPPYLVHVRSTNENRLHIHPLTFSHTVAPSFIDLIEVKKLNPSTLSTESKTPSSANRLVDDIGKYNKDYSAYIPLYKVLRSGIIRDKPQDFDENLIPIEADSPARILEIHRLNRRIKKDEAYVYEPSRTVCVKFAGQDLPNFIAIHKEARTKIRSNLPSNKVTRMDDTRYDYSNFPIIRNPRRRGTTSGNDHTYYIPTNNRYECLSDSESTHDYAKALNGASVRNSGATRGSTSDTTSTFQSHAHRGAVNKQSHTNQSWSASSHDRIIASSSKAQYRYLSGSLRPALVSERQRSRCVCKFDISPCQSRSN